MDKKYDSLNEDRFTRNFKILLKTIVEEQIIVQTKQSNMEFMEL